MTMLESIVVNVNKAVAGRGLEGAVNTLAVIGATSVGSCLYLVAKKAIVTVKAKAKAKKEAC